MLAVALLLAATFTRSTRLRRDKDVRWSERTWLLVTVIVFSIVYVMIVLSSRTFFDASIPVVLHGTLDAYRAARIYVPLLPMALILAISAVHQIAFNLLTKGARRPAARAVQWSAVAAVGCCVLFVALPLSYVATSYRAVSASLAAGHGSTLGPLAPTVRSLPSSIIVATNAPNDAYLSTTRPMLIVPLRQVFITGRKNHAFRRQVSDLATILRDQRGVLLLNSGSLVDDATASDFSRSVTLERIDHYREWSLYRVL